MITISLIVTTYNQKERLALVLDSIKSQTMLPNEVIIADDGSREDTKRLIENYAIHFSNNFVHIWQNDCGFRLAEIRNKAVTAAQSDYIIIIDGDMILNEDFIEDHQKSATESVFVQGSRVILRNNISEKILAKNDFKLAFQEKNLKSWRCPFLSKLIFNNSEITKAIFAKKTLIKGVKGCNMAFYKKDFLAINGFNEDFKSWGREDSEFVARFLFNGGSLRRLKFAAIAYHIYHEESSKEMLAENHQIYMNVLQNETKKCINGSDRNRK